MSKWRLTTDGKLYRKARHEYPNGDIYEGEWVDGKRHGKGVHMYKKSGNKYVGEYVAGKRQGAGVFILGNGGDAYDGEFADDKYHGKGEYTYRNGDRYTGDWFVGRWGGQGLIEYANGDRYEGELKIGLFHGHGTMRWSEESGGGSYTGEFRRGKRHGLGKRVFSNGDAYEGRFDDGHMCGEGTMTRVNGDVYVGEMRDDAFHGHGVVTHSFGDRYEGQFQSGRPYGRGRYTWADGGHYRGEYLAVFDKYAHGVIFPRVNGKRHGKGVRVWVSGNVYEGDWSEDQCNGKGVFRRVDGGVYEGDFVNNTKHGQGVETFGPSKGQPFTCPLGYKHVNRGRQGTAVCKYEGQYVDGLMQGAGVFTCCDGRSYDGKFLRGDRCGEGTQVMIPTLERGDPQREFIGGVDGLYRPILYCGAWEQRLGVQGGERTGDGYVEFANGTRHGGSFRAGVLKGPGWVRDKHAKIRRAHFKFGGVVKWLSVAEDETEDVMQHLKQLAIATKEAVEWQ